MDARDLRAGMIVDNSTGYVIKVTSVPSLDQYGECFFSGILLETRFEPYKDKIGQNFIGNWNSAFHYPV